MALKVCGWAVDHQPVQAAASPAPRPLTDGCPEPPLEKPRMSLDRTSCPMAPARLPVMGGDWKQPPPSLCFTCESEESTDALSDLGFASST